MSSSSLNSPAITPSATTPTGNAGIMPKPIASSGVTRIVTSREWVLPPRPKPGRKPSADTPATKRKAQNRAAQRAFRERRATRVQELEERLSELDKAKEMNEMNLKNVINKLQNENKFLLKALNDIKADYSNFKNKVLSQQPNKTILNSNNNSPAVFSNGQVTSSSPLNYFKLPDGQSPEGVNQEFRFSHQRLSVSGNPNQYPQQLPATAISPANSQTRSPANMETFSPNPTSTSSNSSVGSNNAENFDCGVCVKDDCICAEVGIKVAKPQGIVLENLKPMAPVPLKRSSDQLVEIDYTAKFSKSSHKQMPKFKKLKTSANKEEEDSAKELSTMFEKITDKDFESPMEQCGFCSDESNCVCAQAAKQAANAITELQNHSRKQSQTQVQSSSGSASASPTPNETSKTDSTLPPISRHSSVSHFNKLPVLHPGPSVEIPEHHRSSISTPKETPTEEKQAGGCTGNPGTCTQCQMDPMSTLFCTTVAAKAEEEEEQQQQQHGTSSLTVKQEKPSSPEPSKTSQPAAAEEELNSLKKTLPAITTPASSSPQTPPLLNNKNSSVSGPSSASTPGGSARGIYIPCADAYKTLSRHKEFNSVDFSTLVGKLNTRGMQVEVQSVANVLRELDRRLYS